MQAISWVFWQGGMGRSAQQPVQAGRMPLSLPGGKCCCWDCSVGLQCLGWRCSGGASVAEIHSVVLHPPQNHEFRSQQCKSIDSTQRVPLLVPGSLGTVCSCLTVLLQNHSVAYVCCPPASVKPHILTALGAEAFPCLVLSARASFPSANVMKLVIKLHGLAMPVWCCLCARTAE